jgi:hypothetical protein
MQALVTRGGALDCVIFSLAFGRFPGFRASGFGLSTQTTRGNGQIHPHLCGRRVSLRGWGEEEGTGYFGSIGPAVNVLAGANPDGGAGFGHAIPSDVKLGDVAPAVFRGRQQPEEREVVDIANTSSDRRGPIHRGVLGRRAEDAELERELAAREGSNQLVHGVETEDRLRGREVELGQAEIGAPDVQAHNEVRAIEADLAAFFILE